MLAYEYITGVALDQLPGGPTDEQLIVLWTSVTEMHHSRIAHRDLTASAIIVDAPGRVVLPIPRFGNAFASDLRLSLDRAQLLVSTAQVVGAQRAVRDGFVIVFVPHTTAACTIQENADPSVQSDLLNKLDSLKAQKAALEKAEKETLALLKDKLKQQKDRLKKLGVNVEDGPPASPVAPPPPPLAAPPPGPAQPGPGPRAPAAPGPGATAGPARAADACRPRRCSTN